MPYSVGPAQSSVPPRRSFPTHNAHCRDGLPTVCPSLERVALSLVSFALQASIDAAWRGGEFFLVRCRRGRSTRRGCDAGKLAFHLVRRPISPHEGQARRTHTPPHGMKCPFRAPRLRRRPPTPSTSTRAFWLTKCALAGRDGSSCMPRSSIWRRSVMLCDENNNLRQCRRGAQRTPVDTCICCVADVDSVCGHGGASGGGGHEPSPTCSGASLGPDQGSVRHMRS